MFVTVAVDPAVDAREARGDLVDRAVEVVDPALQRDGEVDEVLAAAAEQRPLRLAHAPHRTQAHQAIPRPDQRRLRRTPTIATITRGCRRDVHDAEASRSSRARR